MKPSFPAEAAIDPPLYCLFQNLRDQARLPLGVDDYLLALEALEAGFGLGGREELAELCQTLWVKSEEERRDFLAVFDRLYPQAAAPAARVEPDAGDGAAVTRPWQEGQRQPPASLAGGPAAEGLKPEAGGPLTVDPELLQEAATLAQLDEIQSFLRRPRAPMGAAGVREKGTGAEFLPVTQRQMKQSWRHLRLAVRAGPPIELDVEQTVANIARKGILLELALRPRRVNRANLLLLLDQGGSMTPFHPLSQRLAETAQRGSRLNQASLYYFHNYPTDYLYSDRYLGQEVALHRVLHQAQLNRSVALIFGDAGAARGGFSAARRDWTYYFLDRLRRSVGRVAWLNPAPRERWAGTTAATIAEMVPMFDFDLEGLQRAIYVLRGHADRGERA